MLGMKMNRYHSKNIAVVFFVIVTLMVIYLKFQSKDDQEILNRKSSGVQYTPRIYTFSSGMWLRNLSLCHREHLKQLSLKTYVKTLKTQIQVYTNDPKEDFLSRDVHRDHIWEPHVFNTIYKHIRSDPEIDLVDLGANLGIISMHIAKLGRNVMSIEPTVHCVTRMCASIAENSLSDMITIVHNAVSNTHEDVQFVLPSKGEFALGFVEQGNIRKEFGKLYGDDTYSKSTIKVKSVMLDDLLSFPDFKRMKKVFIKMDVQGYEKQIFQGAVKFFREVDVKGVYMEWYWHKNKPSGDFMLKKFQEWNYEPFDCNTVLREETSDLDQACIKAKPEESGTWPDDILWLPKKARNL